MAKNGLLQQAYTALKAGHKLEARQLLEQVVAQQPEEFRGWLWLASVTDSPQQALAYVERAARLNPAHPSVAQARAWVQKKAVNSIQYSGTNSRGEAAVKKRPLSPLLWAGVAALFLILFLLGAWVVGNGRVDQLSTGSFSPAAANDQPPATLMAAGLGHVGQNLPPIASPSATPSPTRDPLQAKAVAAHSDPLPTWTTTPTATPTATPTPTPEPTFVSDQTYIQRPAGVGRNERWIDINLTSQTLTAYEGDEPVFSSLISSGTRTHPTVTGQFRVWHRTRSQTMDGRRLGYNYYLENVPYVMYFYRDYAIHGTYWHNNFGTPMSHGCVNMKTEEAEWLFNWSQMGTLVNVRY